MDGGGLLRLRARIATLAAHLKNIPLQLRNTKKFL
jgi:hypothetical protein